MHVLIVEDDEDLRRSLAELLSKAGYAVDATGDGAQAIEMLAVADFLLTDISLPGIDGLELCRQARIRHPPLGVLVMTGFDSPSCRSEAGLRGARGYLAKPFEKEELLGHLREFESASCAPCAPGAGRG